MERQGTELSGFLFGISFKWGTDLWLRGTNMQFRKGLWELVLSEKASGQVETSNRVLNDAGEEWNQPTLSPGYRH